MRVNARFRPHARLAMLLGTALVVSVAFPAATRAVTLADKRAEATRIKQAVDAQAERIAAADAKLRRARFDQQGADAQVRTAAGRLQLARDLLGTARKHVAARAVNAYVHGGQVSVVEHLAASDGADLNLRRHYIDAALRSDREAIDGLQRTEERLAASERGLRAARQAAQRTLELVQTNRDVVASSESVQRANLQRVRGELGALVRQQQQRDLAAALVRARRAAAARPPLAPQLPPVATSAPAPTTTETSAPSPPPDPPSLGGIWACIREKESGNNYRAPGGGAYQFQLGTWLSLGGTGLPEDAPPPVQDEMAIRLQQRSGWSQWTTAAACGAY